jgi:hypothetical protein
MAVVGAAAEETERWCALVVALDELAARSCIASWEALRCHEGWISLMGTSWGLLSLRLDELASPRLSVLGGPCELDRVLGSPMP